MRALQLVVGHAAAACPTTSTASSGARCGSVPITFRRTIPFSRTLRQRALLLPLLLPLLLVYLPAPALPRGDSESAQDAI